MPGEIEAAYAEYLREAHRTSDTMLAARLSKTCGAPLPFDSPEPGYLGTRCSKGTGHAGPHSVLLAGQRLDWT